MKVIVMVGIPGSGKTTKAITECQIYENTLHLSSDNIREELETKDNAEVFAEMNRRLRYAIDTGEKDLIYYDATNTSRRRRRGLYRNIKNWNKDVIVEIDFISVPLTIAFINNYNRPEKQHVPQEVIERMHKQLEVPRKGVDCDSFSVSGYPIFKESTIGLLKSIDNIESLIVLVEPEWLTELKLYDTPHHCAPWHLESVGEHINLAISNAKTSNMKVLAAFHDLGKGITKKRDKTGYATYRNHAGVSAHYYLNYLRLTKEAYEDTREEELDNLEVIHQHMNMHNKLGIKNIRNNRLTDPIIKKAYEFSKIDSMSKITEEN